MDANSASILIILLRTFIPFTILRWPVAGAFLAIAGDISDVMILQHFGWGYFGDNQYHVFDKIFDTWYLFFEFLVVFRWEDIWARRTGQFLYLWRLAGVLIYEFFGFRAVFFFAPNIFENFYLVYTIWKKIRPNLILNRAKLIVLFLICGLPKILQEYLMHFKYPDQTWGFIRDNFFWWLYQ